MTARSIPQKKETKFPICPDWDEMFFSIYAKNFISVDPMRSNSDYDSRGDWCTNSRLGLEANMVYLSAGMVRTLHHNHSHLIASEH